MSAQEKLDDLLGVYRDYLDSYAQRLVDNGPLAGLQKFLSGGPPVADRKADQAFYRDVERAVSELSQALTEADGGVAARAVRYMALEAQGSDSASQLMLEAVQPLAIPLVEALSPDDRGAILAEYQARYPKRRMLSPRQKEFLLFLERKSRQKEPSFS
jgi:phage tail tape-measure protein